MSAVLSFENALFSITATIKIVWKIYYGNRTRIDFFCIVDVYSLATYSLLVGCFVYRMINVFSNH